MRARCSARNTPASSPARFDGAFHSSTLEFKAGVAVAPVTDWHLYDTEFTETYVKTPADNPEGYGHFSLVPRAKDLHSGWASCAPGATGVGVTADSRHLSNLAFRRQPAGQASPGTREGRTQGSIRRTSPPPAEMPWLVT